MFQVAAKTDRVLLRERLCSTGASLEEPSAVSATREQLPEVKPVQEGSMRGWRYWTEPESLRVI
jgi:hypothetical protein